MRAGGDRVNAVLPGLIETAMVDRLKHKPRFQDHYAAAPERHPIRRFGKPMPSRNEMARPAGFEPATLGFEARYSIQLS